MSKKDITSLISGIVGTKEEERPRATESGDVTKETIEALDITPEMEEALNAARRRKVGRPKGTSTEKREREARATFVVDSEQIRKVKYISLAEARLIKDILREALSDYIEKWESNNGRIKLPK